MSENDIQNLSFEDALTQLENIVRELESGRIKLDDAVKAYEKAVALKQLCENDIFPEGCTDNVPNANPFDGSYCLSSTPDSLTVSASEIPADECTLLTARDWPYATSVTCGTGSGNCTSSGENKTLTITFQ